MSRLIDADALIDEINERIEAAIKWGVNAIAGGDKEIKLRAEQAVATFCEASLTAKKMPTIDAVEVVRCRDCKWYKTMYCKMDRWTDLVTVYMAKEDDYCSYGEKWEGAKMYERWKDE